MICGKLNRYEAAERMAGEYDLVDALVAHLVVHPGSDIGRHAAPGDGKSGVARRVSSLSHASDGFQRD